MFDLAITNSGDLSFSKTTKKSSLLFIDFIIAHAPTLKIDFKIDRTKSFTPSNTSILISFELKEDVFDDEVDIVTETNEVMQAIKMRLKTSLSELPKRQEFGSKLEYSKHKHISDKETIQEIESYVKEAIIDILPYATVKAVPFINKTSNTYSQVIKISINNNSGNVYSYII